MSMKFSSFNYLLVFCIKLINLADLRNFIKKSLYNNLKSRRVKSGCYRVIVNFFKRQEIVIYHIYQ